VVCRGLEDKKILEAHIVPMFYMLVLQVAASIAKPSRLRSIIGNA
jgi:hypothetical protein